MIYYVIRHKASGEFMPQLKRGRGYSHWNPSKETTIENLKKKLTGVPRLLPSRRVAHRCIVQWNACPNGKQSWHTSYDGDEFDDLDIKPDGRSKDDLEIVEVNIEEVKIDQV